MRAFKSADRDKKGLDVIAQGGNNLNNENKSEARAGSGDVEILQSAPIHYAKLRRLVFLISCRSSLRL